MNKNKPFWIEKLAFKIFMVKTRIDFWKTQRNKIKVLKNHCSKGFHFLTAHKFKYGKEEVSRVIPYLKCQYCGWAFFLNDEDKNNYIKFKDNLKNNMEKLKDILKLKK